MTSQVVGSRPQGRFEVGVNHTGLVLGLLLGSFHLLWALLVATGWAQALMDFIFWLHFIKPVYVIEAFDPLRACGLVLITGAVGYAIGCAYALLWNRIHNSQG